MAFPSQNRPAGMFALLATSACLALTTAVLWNGVYSADNRLPSPDDPTTIRAIQQRGGRVFVDPHGRVVSVLWRHRPIGDELDMLSLRAAGKHGPGITNRGLSHLALLPKLRWLDVSFNPQITDAGLGELARLASLEILDLSGTTITNDGLSDLGRMARLEQLDLSWTQITDDGLVHLRSLTKLRHLTLPHPARLFKGGWTPYGCTPAGLTALWGLPLEELHGVGVVRENVRYLQGFPRLRRWSGIHYEPVSDAHLVYLPATTSLPSLNVHLADGWGDTSRLRLLLRFPQVESLTISASDTSEHIDPRGLPTLAGLPRLSALRLINITDAGLPRLPKLPALRTLDLTASRVAGDGLTALTRFPRLETLALDRRTLTADGLSHLPLIPSLRVLHLDGTGPDVLVHEVSQRNPSLLTDDALQGLERVPNLRELSLTNLPVSDEALRQLRHVPGLQVLRLDGSEVTDHGLEHLRHVPDLRELHATNLPLTDAAFIHLQRLERLQALFQHGSQITYDAAAEFHRRHGDCYIDDNWCCGCMSLGTYRPKRDE
jgi:Leucine-rich repeat (LRR) protein